MFSNINWSVKFLDCVTKLQKNTKINEMDCLETARCYSLHYDGSDTINTCEYQK